MTRFDYIDHGLLSTFVERWHIKTPSFHLSICVISITLDDVSCILHLPITSRLLNHALVQIIDALDLMVTQVEVNSGKT